MSVSKVDCVATVRGKGRVRMSLYRHLTPVTVSALVGGLPITSRATVYPGAMVVLLTSLKVGVEKQRTEFAKGDIAFFAANSSICVFVANAKSARPLNPIGKIESGLEVAERISSGDVVEIVEVPAEPAPTGATKDAETETAPVSG